VVIIPTASVRACGVHLDPKFDTGLWDIASSLADLMPELVNGILRHATDAQRSRLKRIIVYYADLEYHALLGGLVLATHNLSNMMPGVLRSAHEYTARMFHYYRYQETGKVQLQAIWDKLDRALRNATDSKTVATLEQNVKAARKTYGDLSKARGTSTNDVLHDIVPKKFYAKMHDVYHFIPGVFVHGYLEGLPGLVYHDGKTTVTKDRDRSRMMESFLAHLLRVVFSFVFFALSEFDVPGLKDRVMALFRAYHKAKRRRLTVQPPFPGLLLVKEV
jgi:hypothetical protein